MDRRIGGRGGDSLGGLLGVHLDSLGFTWTHLDSLGLTWTHLDSLGLTWTHLDSLGLTWTHWDSIEFTGTRWYSLREEGKAIGQKGKRERQLDDVWDAFPPSIGSARTHARTTRSDFPVTGGPA